MTYYHFGVAHNLNMYVITAQVTARGHGMQRIGTISPYERWV